ncbi:carbon-nitrogen hydrolase [Thermospira aquatica]|uniref:Carbon-nitrogen hydrolase n=1 Tax=Thermospira aquatica TaxID=2828656 RepID=A0AAX3BDP6_9SPIR|nr:carbon-nitrogen hydrolase [Thermospira aquatica]URA10422.1 carbon-nitrogen hydrolase [Thermospira aquatica]
MKRKLALIQMSCTHDVSTNLQRLTQKIREAAYQKANIICLQELHNTLYFCQEEKVDYFDLAEPIPGPTTNHFSALAKELGVVIVSSIFEKRAPGLYHNTAVVLDTDGSVAGIYRKMHIPDDPGFYEKFYFTPGDLGFHTIQTSYDRLGVLVCWDQWYPEAARLMALEGAEVLIYPTAIGWDPADPQDEKNRQREAWITVQRGHAVANGCYVVAVNRTGYEAWEGVKGIQFWGSSFVAGPQGEILAMAQEEETTLLVEIDLKRSEYVRRIWPFFRDRRIDAFEDLTKRYRD